MREAGDAKAACLLYVISCVFADLANQIEGDPVTEADWTPVVDSLFPELGSAIELLDEEGYGRALDAAAKICGIHRPPDIRH